MQLTEMTKWQHIFLSPHLDDVVLSCGGTLAYLAEIGARRQIITLFAGTPAPDTPFSVFAAYQHDMWRTPQQAYHTRRDEDAAALSCLGIEATWLDFYDCIYRGKPSEDCWYYNSDDDIFGSIHPADMDTVWPIVEAVKAAFVSNHPSNSNQRPAELTIYAPLTAGNHVDHQLTFLVALQFLADGYEVQFYEEYPYADRDPANIDQALYETTPVLINRMPGVAQLVKNISPTQLWRSRIQPFSQDALDLKIKAIAAYQTQLEVLFGGLEAMTQRVRAYANQVGQSKPAERFWLLNQSH
jgi:LmbE family N-acetylglucosaminyl deacetylase